MSETLHLAVYSPVTGNLKRRTTGALVQGNIASSVTTAVMRLHGVTSYITFKSVKLGFDRQSFRGEFSSVLSIRSSGSPVHVKDLMSFSHKILKHFSNNYS